MARERKKKRPLRVLRQGELRANRAYAREALALAWDLCSSDSKRVVIHLDEKEFVHA